MAHVTTYNTANNWYAILDQDVAIGATSIICVENGAEAAIEVPFKFDIGQEIIACSAIALDTPSAGKFTMTVTRAQDSTTAAAYSAGASVQQRIYASNVNSIATEFDLIEKLLHAMNGAADGVQRTDSNDDLKVVAQDTPDMTVKVNDGAGMSNGTVVALLVDTNSSTLVAPSANPRIDTVEIDHDDSTLNIITGVENASPSAPAVGTGNLKLAEIYHRVGETSIKDTDDSTNGYITDSRNFL